MDFTDSDCGICWDTLKEPVTLSCKHTFCTECISHNTITRCPMCLNIESVQTASYKMLKMAAVKIGNAEVSQLLTENFDEAREDLKLFQHIAANYLDNIQ